MEGMNGIADPMVSRGGNVYSLAGMRRLAAALAATKKNGKNPRRAARRVDNRRNAGK